MSNQDIAIDYFTEEYPYHVEMIHSYEFEGDIFRIWYEKGGKSEFSLSLIGLSQGLVEKRFEQQEGKIVYVFQDHEEKQDIAVELVNLVGCCIGIRKMLIG